MAGGCQRGSLQRGNLYVFKINALTAFDGCWLLLTAANSPMKTTCSKRRLLTVQQNTDVFLLGHNPPCLKPPFGNLRDRRTSTERGRSPSVPSRERAGRALGCREALRGTSAASMGVLRGRAEPLSTLLVVKSRPTDAWAGRPPWSSFTNPHN